MKVHVLVEGPSDKVFIEAWAPRAFKGHSFKVHKHQGKGRLPDDSTSRPDPKRRGLLDLLPATLRAFAQTAEAADVAVLVLVDADNDKCVELKERLVALTMTLDPRPKVVFRIAVEETEAFYLGDLRALRQAFPDADMDEARQYVPDAIVGTAELFDRVIGGHGALNKVWWAECIGSHLATVPSRNRSPSFRALCAGIEKLVTPSPKPPRKQRKFRHVSRTDHSRR